MAQNQLLQLCTSTQALAAIVLCYTLAGAACIMYFENSSLTDDQRSLTLQDVDRNFLYKLYSIRTSKLISREQFANASQAEFANWQSQRASLHWQFNSALLYCFTLITTIGYGHQCPTSSQGKAFSVLYSMIGIPLFLLFIGKLGAVTERRLSRTLQQAPLLAAAVAFAASCCLAAPLLALAEAWPIGDAAYFTFISATSIGLGDFVPGQASTISLLCHLLHLVMAINLCTIVFNRVNAWLEQSLVCDLPLPADAAEAHARDKSD